MQPLEVAISKISIMTEPLDSMLDESDCETPYTVKKKNESNVGKDAGLCNEQSDLMQYVSSTCYSELDDEDSDSDLPVIFTNIHIKSETQCDDQENVFESNDSKSKVPLTVERLVEIRRFDLAEAAKHKLQLSEQEAHFKSSADDDLLSSAFENFDVSETFSKNLDGPDRIDHPPPGLPIFVQSAFGFLDLRDITLQNGLENAEFEKNFSMSLACFHQNFLINVSTCQVDSMNKNFHHTFLTYLFKTASTSNDVVVINACKATIERFVSYTERKWPKKGTKLNQMEYLKKKKLLEQLERQKRVKWCPKMRDVYAVFINYGIDIECECPLYDVLKNVRSSFLIKDSNNPVFPSGNLMSDEHISTEWLTVSYNFRIVIEILTTVIVSCCSYTSGELSSIIVLLFWISLDGKILHSNVEPLILECIAKALQEIPEDDWEIELQYLSKTLSTMGHHHRNILHQIKQIPNIFFRGYVLQASTAILALKNIANIQESSDVPRKKCLFIWSVLLTLHQKVRQKEVEDFYVVDTVVSLIDVIVCSQLSGMEKENMDKICDLALQISQLLHGLAYPEKIKVREHLVRVTCKWKVIFSDQNCMKENEVFQAVNKDALLTSMHVSSPESVAIPTLEEVSPRENKRVDELPAISSQEGKCECDNGSENNDTVHAEEFHSNDIPYSRNADFKKLILQNDDSNCKSPSTDKNFRDYRDCAYLNRYFEEGDTSNPGESDVDVDDGCTYEFTRGNVEPSSVLVSNSVNVARKKPKEEEMEIDMCIVPKREIMEIDLTLNDAYDSDCCIVQEFIQLD